MSFSERYGLKPKKAIQLEGMDEELRTFLWNYFYTNYWFDIFDPNDKYKINISKDGTKLFYRIWLFFLKKSITKIDFLQIRVKETLELIFIKTDWYKVYDFLEFFIQNCPREELNKNFTSACNKIFEQESAPYRFIDNKIVSITSETEIKEIEKAIENPLSGVKEHLNTAIQHYANRKKPNYRNSISESILAVESICEKITGENVLSKALNSLEQKGLKLHPALREGFIKFYGYAGDEDGIRHSIKNNKTTSKIEKEDAHFFLVSCSAFVNYLTVKAEKLGIIIASA